jgi:small subunit ribosomal protein S4e
MVKNHLKRISAPKNWLLKRKAGKFVAKPLPGAHPLNASMTLNYLVIDVLNHAKTAKEVRKILHDKQLLVDNVVRGESKFSVGLMDVVEIPKLKEAYRISLDEAGRLTLVTIDDKEKNLKLLKIIGKTVIKKGKFQLNAHDGKNILVEKFEVNVGDTVVYDLTKKKIVKNLSLEKGAQVLLTAGKHVGRFGAVKEMVKEGPLQKKKLVFDMDGTEFITSLNYAFVVGKSKAEVTLKIKK